MLREIARHDQLTANNLLENRANRHLGCINRQENRLTSSAVPRPVEYPDDRVVKSVRIPAGIDAELRAVAHDRQVSVNLVINWALEDFLRRAKPAQDLRPNEA